MSYIGGGTTVVLMEPVRGQWRLLTQPSDVVDLMEDGAAGLIAVVREAGATYLGPLYDELTAIVCTSGTPRSHIGIMAREYRLPCIVGARLEREPGDGARVEVDCSLRDGIIRAC